MHLVAFTIEIYHEARSIDVKFAYALTNKNSDVTLGSFWNIIFDVLVLRHPIGASALVDKKLFVNLFELN